MGVGLSSMQKLTGTIIGSAAIAGKSVGDSAEKTKEAESIKTEQGMLAKEQFHEASADITRLTGKSEEAEKELVEKAAISDSLASKKPGGKGNTKQALEEKRMKALSEVEAARRAFDELQDRIEAKKAMIKRAQLIMKRTGVKE